VHETARSTSIFIITARAVYSSTPPWVPHFPHNKTSASRWGLRTVDRRPVMAKTKTKAPNRSQQRRCTTQCRGTPRAQIGWCTKGYHNEQRLPSGHGEGSQKGRESAREKNDPGRRSGHDPPISDWPSLRVGGGWALREARKFFSGDKVTLVTGASRGLGARPGPQAAERGAIVGDRLRPPTPI